jgi:hypothetical protein
VSRRDMSPTDGTMSPMSSKIRLAVLGILAPFVIGGSLLVGATPASAEVLVSAPRERVCRDHTFKVGVWNNYDGGSRRYRVNVFSPAGNRVFHHHGKATHTWKYWRIRAYRLGRYKTVYRSGRGAADPWKVRFITRSHRC